MTNEPSPKARQWAEDIPVKPQCPEHGWLLDHRGRCAAGCVPELHITRGAE